MRDIKINFWTTVEEEEKIISNAKRYGLSVSAYLRRLGVLGVSPFTQQSSGGIVMDAQGYEGLEVRQKNHETSVKVPRRKRSA